MESVYGDAARPSAGRARRGELSDALGRLLERVPRVVRFVAVGGVCAALQLLALSALGRLGVELHAANTVAFLLPTQANFALSSVVTWRDRLGPAQRPASVGRRLASYNGMALGCLVVNQAVFALAVPFAHYLAASAAGILGGALINYTVSGRVVFPRPGRA